METSAALPVFLIATVYTVVLLWWVAHSGMAFQRRLWFGLLVGGWLLATYFAAATGYLADPGAGVPPRFSRMVLPPLAVIGALLALPAGRAWLRSRSLLLLTRVHAVRVPVEIAIWLWYGEGLVPVDMTFEGRNFDVLMGLSAPLVAYWGVQRGQMARRWLVLWNVVGLMLLVNIVTTAVLSLPTPLQVFGLTQPNVAVLTAPNVWLPAFIVPVVLFAHVAALVQLLGRKA